MLADTIAPPVPNSTHTSTDVRSPTSPSCHLCGGCSTHSLTRSQPSWRLKFLADNVALIQRMDESQSSPPLFPQWALCWMMYMYTGTQCRTHESGSMARPMAVLSCNSPTATGGRAGSNTTANKLPQTPEPISDGANGVLHANRGGDDMPPLSGVRPGDHRAEECALLSIDPYLEPALHKPPRT